MTTQKYIESSPAIGVLGAKADMNTFDYYPQSLFAYEPLTIGSFVWLGENKKNQASYANKSETSAPVGFIERSLTYLASMATQESTTLVNKGQSLTVATKGAFYAVATTNATVGQSVFAVRKDGSIVTADKGTQVDNAIDTGWTVSTGGNAFETIIIKRS